MYLCGLCRHFESMRYASRYHKLTTAVYKMVYYFILVYCLTGTLVSSLAIVPQYYVNSLQKGVSPMVDAPVHKVSSKKNCKL